MTFRLGALPGPTPGPPSPPRPRGRLLAPMVDDPLLLLPEEEVPREGAHVTRDYQLARCMDGGTYLWLARRKTTGRGEGSSGLRFDITEPSV